MSELGVTRANWDVCENAHDHGAREERDRNAGSQSSKARKLTPAACSLRDSPEPDETSFQNAR